MLNKMTRTLIQILLSSNDLRRATVRHGPELHQRDLLVPILGAGDEYYQLRRISHLVTSLEDSLCLFQIKITSTLE